MRMPINPRTRIFEVHDLYVWHGPKITFFNLGISFSSTLPHLLIWIVLYPGLSKDCNFLAGEFIRIESFSAPKGFPVQSGRQVKIFLFVFYKELKP